MEMLLLLGILAAGIMRIVSVCRNETTFMDYERRKIQHRLDRYKSKTALLDEAEIDLIERRGQIEALGSEIDKLRHEKEKTKTDVFAIIDRLNNIGLAASNKRKYLLDLSISFGLGIITSVIGSYIWNYWGNSVAHP